MEGVKQIKPFFARTCPQQDSGQLSQNLNPNSEQPPQDSPRQPSFRSHPPYLNPFSWPTRLVKVLTAAFFMIMLPIYFFIGFQPAPLADAASYPPLKIPAINLETPVTTVELVNHQLAVPATIAGVYQPFENKLFIIGHSSTVFQNLDQLSIEDQITYDGELYTIIDRITLPKSDISMNDLLADAPQKTIIIMTCAGEPLPNQDATHRLILTATLSE